jgi:hypothetical protein
MLLHVISSLNPIGIVPELTGIRQPATNVLQLELHENVHWISCHIGSITPITTGEFSDLVAATARERVAFVILTWLDAMSRCSLVRSSPSTDWSTWEYLGALAAGGMEFAAN